MFLSEAYIIETNGKAIHTFGRVELEGEITHIIHEHNSNKEVGKNYTFPFDCSYDDILAIEFIFTKFMKVISFKPY